MQQLLRSMINYSFLDPMVARETTLEHVQHIPTAFGQPKDIAIKGAVGTKKEVENVTQVFHGERSLWVTAIVASLNKKSYIVSSLGDAGDLALKKMKPKNQLI